MRRAGIRRICPYVEEADDAPLFAELALPTKLCAGYPYLFYFVSNFPKAEIALPKFSGCVPPA
jgi:hypothetical protein